MRDKGKLRNIVVKGIEWKYIIEHNMGRKAEVRIYNPQIIKRIEFSELGFDEYQIEHGGCNITPKIIREYIQNNLNQNEDG
jgi:hypothetical protein